MNLQRDQDAWRMRNLVAQNQANINRITTQKNNEIQTIYDRNREEVRRLNTQFDQRYQQQQQAFDRQYGSLNTQYLNLGNRFEDLTGAFNDLGDQYEAQGAQLEKTTGLFEEQTRLANNKARASVPTPVQSAVSPISGDSRQLSKPWAVVAVTTRCPLSPSSRVLALLALVLPVCRSPND